jgi:DNA-binding response OmpR family regulator
MLTVLEGEDIKAKAFEAGAFEYIEKAISFRDLVARIRAAVDSRIPEPDQR